MKQKNDEKLKGIKEEAENMMKAIKEQYDISKDNIMNYLNYLFLWFLLRN